MKEILIHVGIHKTGSTSLQTSLVNFDDGSSFYPDLSDPNHSVPFQTMFSHDHLNDHWTRLGESTADQVNRVGTLFQTAIEKLEDRNRVIFSGENISLLTQIDLRKIKDFFTARFSCRFRILMLIRSPIDWISSMIQEEVKHGAILDAEKKYGIYERYRNLASVFENEVEVRDYDSLCAPDGDVVSRFCEIAGIALPQRNKLDINKSLFALPLKLVHLFNRSAIPTYNGNIIYMTKWRFISRLNSIFSGSAPIEKNHFRCFADINDFSQMYKTIGQDIQMSPGSFGELRHYMNDIDEDFAKRGIVAHLSDTGFSFNKNCSLSELLQVLFLFEMFEAGKASQRDIMKSMQSAS